MSSHPLKDTVIVNIIANIASVNNAIPVHDFIAGQTKRILHDYRYEIIKQIYRTEPELLPNI